MRKDVWDYPLPAIREILLNAIVHRNYHLHNMQTQIRIYDDHILFHNAGGLPEGMTMDLLKSSHRSVARNPLISKIFYLSGLIEEYGTGIKRIMDSMKEANLVEPVFKEEMGGFSVYILKNVYDESYFQEQGLNERQIRIMMYVMDKGSVRIEDCFKLSPAVGERTHQRDLNILIESKLLVKKRGIKKYSLRKINMISFIPDIFPTFSRHFVGKLLTNYAGPFTGQINYNSYLESDFMGIFFKSFYI